MTAYCTLQWCISFGLAHLWGRVTFLTENARSGRASLDMKLELTDKSLLILGAVFFLGYPPLYEMERESHVFSFFSFHNTDLKILETDAA